MNFWIMSLELCYPALLCLGSWQPEHLVNQSPSLPGLGKSAFLWDSHCFLLNEAQGSCSQMGRGYEHHGPSKRFFTDRRWMSSMPATYSPLSSLSEQPGLGAAMLRGSERTRRRSVSFLLSFSFPSPSSLPLFLTPLFVQQIYQALYHYLALYSQGGGHWRRELWYLEALTLFGKQTWDSVPGSSIIQLC